MTLESVLPPEAVAVGAFGAFGAFGPKLAETVGGHKTCTERRDGARASFTCETTAW